MSQIQSIIGEQTSVIRAVQQVGEYIDDSSNPAETAKSLIKEFLPNFNFNRTVDFLRIGAQAIAELFVKDQQIEEQVIVDRAERLIAKHPFFDTEEQQSTSVHPVAAVVPKQPSKQQQAIALYKQNSSMTPVEFRNLLIAELGMTKAGAQTYAFNCRKLWIEQ